MTPAAAIPAAGVMRRPQRMSRFDIYGRGRHAPRSGVSPLLFLLVCTGEVVMPRVAGYRPCFFCGHIARLQGFYSLGGYFAI